MVCSSCDTATDHCHGTVIIHTGTVTECTDDGCVNPDRLRHTFVIDCVDLAGGCDCVDLSAARRAS